MHAMSSFLRRAPLAAAFAFAAPALLHAQAAPATRTIPVLRGDDGTEVAIDSASLGRTGDGRFGVKTIVRFSEPVQMDGGLTFDREVDVQELDCARGKARVFFSHLYRGDAMVLATRLNTGWVDVAPEHRPVFDASCQTLTASYASLPLEADSGTAQVQPRLVNASEVQRALVRSFPPLLRDQGAAGEVKIRERIRDDGVVDQASIETIDATDYRFAQAAREVVMKMRFAPARLGGRPLPYWMNIPVTFQLAGPRGAPVSF